MNIEKLIARLSFMPQANKDIYLLCAKWGVWDRFNATKIKFLKRNNIMISSTELSPQLKWGDLIEAANELCKQQRFRYSSNDGSIYELTTDEESYRFLSRSNEISKQAFITLVLRGDECRFDPEDV